ncbi:MAG: hypothetical protein ACRDNF_21745 [Streptosporangiaceae bacterium]
MTARTPNLVLRGLVRETGCSYEALASRINHLGAQDRLRLTYGRSALAQWISRHVPPPRVRDLCAAVLSSKLGRTLTADQIWPTAAIGHALVPDPSLTGSVRLLEALAREDVDRRDVLISTGYVAAAAVVPAWQWLFLPPAGQPPRRAVTAPDRAARRRADVSGAAAVRPAGPQQRRRAAPPGARPLHQRAGHPILNADCGTRADRDRFAAAALLTRKAALMASDDHRPGLAQAYFTQALQMAKASGDRAIGAHVLVSMSHQATDAGDPATAAGLAEAARSGAGKAAPPALQAKIAIMRARAEALLGDERECRHQIGCALDCFATANAGPWWAANVTSAYVHGQVACCHQDLGRPRAAYPHALHALQAHSPGHIRRQAMGGFLLARVCAAAGEPEQAAQAAGTALALIGGLGSSRTLAELRLLRRSLGRYQQVPAVRDFLRQTHPPTPARPAP